MSKFLFLIVKIKINDGKVEFVPVKDTSNPTSGAGGRVESIIYKDD